MVSTASIAFIAIGVAVLGVAAYFTYNLLNEDSPTGQLARSRLGLDKYPGAGILQDPRVASYKPSPSAPGYKNLTKPFIESPLLSNKTREFFKDVEKRSAEQYYGKAGFLYSMAAEEARPEPWALLTR